MSELFKGCPNLGHITVQRLFLLRVHPTFRRKKLFEIEFQRAQWGTQESCPTLHINILHPCPTLPSPFPSLLLPLVFLRTSLFPSLTYILLNPSLPAFPRTYYPAHLPSCRPPFLPAWWRGTWQRWPPPPSFQHISPTPGTQIYTTSSTNYTDQKSANFHVKIHKLFSLFISNFM